MIELKLTEFIGTKRVYAARIHRVEKNPDRGALLYAEGADGEVEIYVDEFYVLKHGPQAGGYYIIYDNGYQSFSPGGVFERAYSKVSEDLPTDTFEHHVRKAIEAARDAGSGRKYSITITKLEEAQLWYRSNK